MPQPIFQVCLLQPLPCISFGISEAKLLNNVLIIYRFDLIIQGNSTQFLKSRRARGGGVPISKEITTGETYLKSMILQLWSLLCFGRGCKSSGEVEMDGKLPFSRAVYRS